MTCELWNEVRKNLNCVDWRNPWRFQQNIITNPHCIKSKWCSWLTSCNFYFPTWWLLLLKPQYLSWANKRPPTQKNKQTNFVNVNNSKPAVYQRINQKFYSSIVSICAEAFILTVFFSHFPRKISSLNNLLYKLHSIFVCYPSDNSTSHEMLIWRKWTLYNQLFHTVISTCLYFHNMCEVLYCTLLLFKHQMCYSWKVICNLCTYSAKSYGKCKMQAHLWSHTYLV